MIKNGVPSWSTNSGPGEGTLTDTRELLSLGIRCPQSYLGRDESLHGFAVPNVHNEDLKVRTGVYCNIICQQ